MTVKGKMLLMTLLFLLGWLGAAAAYRLTEIQLLYTAAITLGTVFYHFAMRLTVGFVVNARFHNRMDDTKKWFQERGFEAKLYAAIRVKKWKRYLPSFRPEDFSLGPHTAKEVMQTSCQAEIVHEIIMALSFIPVIFSIWVGSAGIFLITSWAAFLIDGVFVVSQRYNRPRLRRLIENTPRRNGTADA